MYAPVSKLPIASAAQATRPSTTSGAGPITGQGIGETHHALRDVHSIAAAPAPVATVSRGE